MQTNIRAILGDRYRPFSFQSGRRFSWKEFGFAFVLPGLIAALVAHRHQEIAKDYQVTVLTIFSIIATVFTAMLPVVQAVVGSTDANRKFDPAEAAVWANERTRLEVLRSLYSLISFAVVSLVASLIPLLVLQIPDLSAMVKQVVAGLIYFVGALVAVSFVEIVGGVYLVLDAQARRITQSLRDNSPKVPNAGIENDKSDVGGVFVAHMGSA